MHFCFLSGPIVDFSCELWPHDLCTMPKACEIVSVRITEKPTVYRHWRLQNVALWKKRVLSYQLHSMFTPKSHKGLSLCSERAAAKHPFIRGKTKQATEMFGHKHTFRISSVLSWRPLLHCPGGRCRHPSGNGRTASCLWTPCVHHRLQNK